MLQSQGIQCITCWAIVNQSSFCTHHDILCGIVFQKDLSLRSEMINGNKGFESKSFSNYKYPRSSITSEDGMSKQQIVADTSSQNPLHILNVLAPWVFLCSSPYLWLEEDVKWIIFDKETDEHNMICAITYQFSLTVDCRLYGSLYYQNIGVIYGMLYFTPNQLQVLTEKATESLLSVLISRNLLFWISWPCHLRNPQLVPALPPIWCWWAQSFVDSSSWYPSKTIMPHPYFRVT